MLMLTILGLYLLVRLCRKGNRSNTKSVIPIILESLALVLVVIWRTVSAASRMTRW
jgi:hypothetical protein